MTKFICEYLVSSLGTDEVLSKSIYNSHLTFCDAGAWLRKVAAFIAISESMETLIERPRRRASSTYINAKVFKRLSVSLSCFESKLRDSMRHSRNVQFGVVPSGTQASSKLQSRPYNGEKWS